MQEANNVFGVWHKSSKPSTDRFFTPQEKNDESKVTFLTCPPAECADPKYKLLLESKSLVTSIAGGKKYLDLPVPFFDEK